MQPIGLTIKATGKKYGRSQGELMLIHVCEECKALSINRIAADDDPYRLFAVFEESSGLEPSTLARLEFGDIKILNIVDREPVQVQLFGPGSVPAGIHSRRMALESV